MLMCGFNPDHLLLVLVDPSLRGYSQDKSVQFQQQLLQQTADLPGVSSASLSASVPFINGYSWDLAIDGYTAPGGEKFVDTATNQVAPGYFRTMQISLLRGREFSAHDDKKSPLVAIVNETLVRKYIVGDEDLERAIGHNLQLRDQPHVSIVGVVKDSLTGGIGSPARPIFYTPYAQMGGANATLFVRTEGEPGAMTSLIREQLRKLDPEVAPLSVVTMRTVVSSQGLFSTRFAALLGGAFGGAGVVSGSRWSLWCRVFHGRTQDPGNWSPHGAGGSARLDSAGWFWRMEFRWRSSDF